MGLDTSHDCWHGAYSAFMRWRQKLAEIAGLPPLPLMEGFWTKSDIYDPIRTDAVAVDHIYAALPIRWDVLRPDVLYELLYHSDCDGELRADICGPLADRLAQLLPFMPEGEGGGHIGIWRDKTQKFIDGLRAAAAAGEAVDFH